jgi:hypothetical protein
MTDSPEHNTNTQTISPALKKRLNRHVNLARLWLFWEIYVPVFLLAVLSLCVFLIGVFAGIWERIGDPWRGLGLLATLYILIVATYRAQKRPIPSRSDAKRRVETDSRQSHRPLDVLEDKPAIGKDSWNPHYENALGKARRLKRPTLVPSIKPHDRYYLRFIVPLLLAGAMVLGSGSNMERLRRSVLPIWQSGINPNDVTFEAWIDPPEYTGRPPIYFKGQDVKAIPAGSEWVARLKGAKNAPRPKLLLSGKTRYLRITQLGPESFEARSVINQSGKGVWRIGPTRKVWDLNVVPDQAPTVSFNETPDADKQDRLVIPYSFEDDYGVTELHLEMAEILSGDSAPFSNSKSVSIPLSGGSLPKAEGVEARLDLTRHVLAGKKIVARLVASDGAGQFGYSENQYFTVPDKIFVEPLAKAIVEQRNLILSALDEGYAPEPTARYKPGVVYDTFEPELRLNRAPKNIQRAALLIEAVTDRPDGVFQDPTVYLTLRNVRSRLRYTREAHTLKPIPDEMWSIALRAEFGVLGTALQEMREAEQALREGMARRSPQREIDTLFERYNNAVDAYTEELRRKAMEEGNFADEEGGGGSGLQSTNEIEELLKAIEEANKAGDVEGARLALARLAEVLENMEVQLSRSQGSGGGDGLQGEMSEEMKENLEELADLLGEQRELQDETEEAQREADRESGNNGAGEAEQGNALTPGELAQRQENLESLLSELGENAANLAQPGADTGESPSDEPSGNEGQSGGSNSDNDGEDPTSGQSGTEDGGGASGESESAQQALSRAQGAMSDAARALNEGNFGGASEAQEDAIKALRQAGQSLAEAAMAQSGEPTEGSDEQDPLGRDNSGLATDDSDVDIDNRDNATRSRELLEELRRRAAEQERSQEERDYLERLLKRF